MNFIRNILRLKPLFCLLSVWTLGQPGYWLWVVLSSLTFEKLKKIMVLCRSSRTNCSTNFFGAWAPDPRPRPQSYFWVTCNESCQWSTCDKKIPTLIMSLDLRAAFDTVHQGKLIQNSRPISGTFWKIEMIWVLESNLCCRTQTVKIGDSYSS